MKPASSLSALIIAKDEERDLPDCLASLGGLVSEIVVLVDEASSDRTEELARSAGAKTARRAFDDYARQRQAALELCSQDWVLWIDADERVSPELAESIRAELDNPRGTAYEVAFEVWFMGRRLRWGGLGGERHVRLFAREGARFVGGMLHEGVEAGAGRRALPLPGGAMRHHSYRDLADYMGKLDRYTSLAAEKRFSAGRRFRVWHHLILPWEFFSRAFLKLGVLDGLPGLVWAGLSAFHSWLKYVKLGELEKR